MGWGLGVEICWKYSFTTLDWSLWKKKMRNSCANCKNIKNGEEKGECE
jgi:hypothetical protein